MLGIQPNGQKQTPTDEPTIKTILNRYGSRLSQPRTNEEILTQRKMASVNEVSSLMSTMKSVGRGKENRLQQTSAERELRRRDRENHIVLSELQTTQQHLQLLVSQKQTLAQQLKNTQNELNSLRNAMEQIANDKQRLREQLSEKQWQQEQTREQVAQHIDQQAQELEQANKRLQVLEQQLKHKDDRIGCLMNKLRIQQQEHIQLADVNKLLKEKLLKNIRLTEDEAAESARVLTHNIEQRLAQHQSAQYSLFQRHLHELTVQIDKLKQQHEALTDVHQRTIQHLQQENEELKTEQSRLIELCHQTQTLYKQEDANRLNQLQKWTVMLRHSADHHINQVQSNFSHAIHQMKNDNKHIQQLAKTMDAHKIHQWKQHLALSNQISKCQSELSNKTQQLGAAEANIGVLSSYCSRLQYLNKLLEQENKELKHKVTLLSTDIVNCKHTVAKLNHSLATLTEKITTNNQQLTNSQLKIKLLTQQLQSIQEEKNKLQQLHMTSSHELQTLLKISREKEEQLQTINKELCSQITQMQSDYGQLKTHYEDRIQLISRQHSSRIDNLKQQGRPGEQIELDEKHKVYSEMKCLQRQYEKFKSQVVGINDIVRIMDRVSRRVSANSKNNCRNLH